MGGEAGTRAFPGGARVEALCEPSCGEPLGDVEDPPDVQSMLLLTNLFGTTVDELVRGGVDETCEMVEKDKRRTKTFAVVSACS